MEGHVWRHGEGSAPTATASVGVRMAPEPWQTHAGSKLPSHQQPLDLEEGGSSGNGRREQQQQQQAQWH